MNLSRYYLELGATNACTKRFMDETKGLWQRSLKGSTRDCFPFESWFLTKNSVEAVVYIGVDSIGIVKTNTRGFFKDTI